MAENNSTILNAVWLNGTNDFQQRVPQPTQSSIDRTVSALLDPLNSDLYNQFVDTLIKRIGMVKVHSDEWKNPLREFKGSSLIYGTSIQEIAPKWIQAHAYSFDSTLLDVNAPKAAEWFHSINRFDKYPISINDIEIRKSFTDEFGLNNLVSGFLQQPINGDEYDEYRIMMQLIAIYEKKWGFYKIELADSPTTAEGAKDLMTQVRTMTGKLRYPSMLYNAGVIDVPVFAKPEELMLLVTPDVEAYMDVNVLSSLFHVELADIDVRRIVVDEFPVPTCKALLTTKDWFVCHDTVKQMTSFYDPSNLCTNYYYHRQGVYSMSPFVPAIMFTYGAESTTVNVVTEDVTGLTLTPATATVEKGGTLQLVAKLEGTVSGTGSEDFKVLPDSTSYEIVNDKGVCPKATYVDRYDILHVGKTVASGSKLTVKLTSSYINPSDTTTPYTAQCVVTVK